MSNFLTLSTHIRVNPRNLWETSTYHRIIEHGCQRYHGWRLRRGSPTDATDYHRFLISARNIRVIRAAIRVLTLCTYIRVNPRNLWETSTHHRIIEHGFQRYHGWRLRRCSPTDTTDYHRFLISARNIRVMLMITAFYCYICFTHHQKACFSFISTTSVIRFIINTLSTCKINLSSLKQHETTKVLLRIVDELILRQRKQITNN